MQLNVARVVCYELRVLVDQMQQCANATAQGGKEILAHYWLVLDIIHFSQPNKLNDIACRHTPYTHWSAGCRMKNLEQNLVRTNVVLQQHVLNSIFKHLQAFFHVNSMSPVLFIPSCNLNRSTVESGGLGCIFEPSLPTEKHRHMDRFECWNNAAKYSLNQDTIKTVLEWPDQKALVTYMQGLLSTALVCIRMDLPNSARTYGQHTVFSRLRAPETQLVI